MSAPSPNRLMYIRGVVKGASSAYDAMVIDHAGHSEPSYAVSKGGSTQTFSYQPHG